MSPHRRQRIPDLLLGPLPTELINAVLDLELEPGPVVFTRSNQVHANTRHPVEYPLCLPHLGQIITEPMYIGDDHRNPGKIELIRKVQVVDSFVLVAVDLTRDDQGRYRVSSFYVVTDQKIQQRREKGFLRVAVMPPNR